MHCLFRYHDVNGVILPVNGNCFCAYTDTLVVEHGETKSTLTLTREEVVTGLVAGMEDGRMTMAHL